MLSAGTAKMLRPASRIRLLALLARHAAQRLDDLDAEGFGGESHGAAQSSAGPARLTSGRRPRRGARAERPSNSRIAAGVRSALRDFPHGMTGVISLARRQATALTPLAFRCRDVDFDSDPSARRRCTRRALARRREAGRGPVTALWIGGRMRDRGTPPGGS